MRVVVALGGNALLRRHQPLTAENQRENVRIACEALAPIAAEHELVISHGNGPQVGLLALQGSAYGEVETYPLDVLDAQTEGMIGYLIEQELGNLLPAETPIATLLTMIEVDPADPAFDHPTKPIGPVYDREQARPSGSRARAGRFHPDGDGVRRVVPSPRPQRIIGLRPIEWLIERGLRRHLRRRRRHPDDVHRRSGAGRPAPGRDRGRDRQGSRQRPPGRRHRRRHAGDRHRRRRACTSTGENRASER